MRIEQRGALATVTLNRPKVRNALNSELSTALTRTFHRLAGKARVVVLRGEGPAFCAGADIEEMQRLTEADFDTQRAQAMALQQMFQAIGNFPGVTIARVHGAAIGGGAGLAAVCDIAIAAEEAFFAFSEVRIGLIPATIAPWVVQKVGLGTARALFVTGERITATEALRIGLVQQVAMPNALDEAIERKVEAILQCGPEAIAAVKRLLLHLQGFSPATFPMAETADITVFYLIERRMSAEAREGFRAFLEKRRPSFHETLP
ncbi:enoyl-CoA hydratase-related protein [Chthonomonas calidirosea]|uniref:enoyl-CoA hydratase-related protein n=1 Tax=Chthonomonas calidirosea TaxID=454171 RepID=UPI00155A1132|nr:enoyl-CoA hydratase-related protein [Chthonomonas calidirosea]